MKPIERKNNLSKFYLNDVRSREYGDESKPFLKWAGGKGQLVEEFEKRLPQKVKKKRVISTYVEPFLGGGAMFFYLRNKFRIKKAFLFDINADLIVAYSVVKNDPKILIEELCELQEIYFKKSPEERKKFYYEIRDIYNKQLNFFDFDHYSSEWIQRAKYLIFLNKTCFNGLYRLNKKREFNVPFGKYKNPKICDKDNLINASKALKVATIFNDDFEKSAEYIEKETFVYLDPPYRPLSKTANFTSYTANGFSDYDQKRLFRFFKRMDKKGAFLLLSNSDPKNLDPNDNFFDDLYKDFYIERVFAKRSISCDPKKRGHITEIIVRNYK